MHKPLQILSGCISFICFLAVGNLSLAQTYPTPQTLPYSQNFGTSAFSTAPAGTNSFTRTNNIITQALAEAATPLGDAPFVQLTGTIANSQSTGTFGYSQNGTNAFVLIQTDRSGTANASNSFIVGLNTSGWVNVNFGFQLAVTNGSSASGVVFQYRVGTTGAWTNLSGANNPVIATSGTTNYNLSYQLPAACNNQAAVYIRWSPWNGETNNNVALRFRYGVDNITASGTPLPPSPGGIYGANLWLKGNTGTTPASGTLTNWVDQTSTNTFTVSGNPQTGVSTNQINFNNAVAFDGSGDWLTGNTNITFQTLYAVINRDNTLFTTVLSATLPNNQNIGYMMKGDRMATGNNDAVSTLWMQSQGSLGSGKPRLGVVEIVNNQNATQSKSYIDGTFYPTELLTGSGTQMKNFSAIPYVGRSQNTAVPNEFAGKIAELAMYPASHTATERLRVESYLAVKYGITLTPTLADYLSATGTSIWSNTSYWNDVFGIGRDDASTLNQTQSNSVNTGSGNGIGQPGKANITISSTGALTNGQYLMVGNDAGALTDNAKNLPPTLFLNSFTRLVRQWKVANTGGTGNVNLVFDTSGLVLSGKFSSSLADYYLAIDGDGDGDFNIGANNISPTSFTANGLSFQNVSLPNNAVFTLAVKLVNPLNKWTGAVDSQWSNINNWSLFRRPLTTDSVVIDKTLPYGKAPVLNIPFSVGYQLKFVNNPDFRIAPGGMLSVAAGATADVTSLSKYIMSDSSGSGLIGPVDGIMLGNSADSWTIERWFGARRSFRYIASPVTPTVSPLNTIRQLWMGGDTPGDAWNYPYPLGSPQYRTKGYFTNITGGTKANGFDQNQTGNPSLWIWAPSTQTWSAITASTDFVAARGTGYRLVVRGDRGTNLDQNRPTASETRIWFVGSLLNDSYNVPSATIAPQDTGYSFIANPYQGMVDATKINRTGMTNYMYIWDARIIGTKGFGAFVTVDLPNNTNNMGNINPDYSSAADKWIQPGQAVFFQNDPAGITPRAITFSQTALGGPTERRRIFGSDPAPNAGDIVSQVNLWSTSEELNVSAPVDGLTIRFGSQYTTAADYEDGSKLNNTDESLSVWNNNRSVSIDKRNLPGLNEIVQLNMSRLRVTNYKWVISGMDLTSVGLQAYLKDAYLGIETEIPANAPVEVGFSVDPNIAASISPTRFTIVFKTGAILPIRFVKLETEQQGQQFNLLWNSSAIPDGSIFEIQRSADGRQFDKISSVPGSITTTGYNWLDASPVKGFNFYRIKLTEPNGNVVFSNIARVNLSIKGAAFDVYPNPVKGRCISIYLNNLPAGNYQVSLVNASGQSIQQTELQHSGGSASRQLNLSADLPYGNYQVILWQNSEKYIRKIIIE